MAWSIVEQPTDRSKLIRLVLLGGCLLLAVWLAVAIGAVRLHLTETLQALGLLPLSTPDRTIQTIIWELRLPRALLAACVGAKLAVAGSAYQGLFRNPLAEPYIIGTASGAALGVTLVIVCQWTAAVPLGAFCGALVAAGLTYGLSTVVRVQSLVGLLLTGVAVGTMLNATVWVLMVWNDQDLGRIIAWLLGSFSGRGWSELARVLPWLLVGLLGLWLLARPLDALAEGTEVARGLGLRVALATGAVVALASLMTAAAVAAAGIIGFVGLIAPHIARQLVGERYAWLLPASAMLGGLLLVVADTFARTLTAPVELPVGVVTAAVGGPFLLMLLGRQRA
jgi:iron complex transport system permease protein